MAMKISFENVLVKGVKKYKLVRVEGVMKESLIPEVYQNMSTCVYTGDYLYNGNVILYINHASKPTCLNIGDVISEDKKKVVLSVLEKAGENLRNVNLELRDLKENWEGNTETFVI